MATRGRLSQGSGAGFSGRGQWRPPVIDDEPISEIGQEFKAHPDKLQADGVGYCTRCYVGNAFWRERCQRCGAPKPYLYADEILGNEFSDL